MEIKQKNIVWTFKGLFKGPFKVKRAVLKKKRERGQRSESISPEGCKAPPWSRAFREGAAVMTRSLLLGFVWAQLTGA